MPMSTNTNVPSPGMTGEGRNAQPKGNKMSSKKKSNDQTVVDTIDVIFPSPVAPHAVLTDHVSRSEFLARMNGTGAGEQVRRSPLVGVIALMEVEALLRWLTTRPGGVELLQQGVHEATR
jgi:hypothetical protein